MSNTTEPNTESSASESNSNGKREREDEARIDEEPTSKVLRSSDDSDEKESDALSSIDVTPVPELDKGGSAGGSVDDEGKTEEETPAPPEEGGEPGGEQEASVAEAKPTGYESTDNTAIQLDRAGQAVTAEIPVVVSSPDPTPAPAGLTAEGVDPNAAATLVNPSQIVEEQGTVSALYVGRVIGKVNFCVTN